MAERTARRSTRYALRGIVIVYLALGVIWPVALVTRPTFADGVDAMAGALSDPLVTRSLWLTAQVAFSAVVVNTVFGVGISLLLVRYRFPGRRALSALIDLPLSVSPVVVGLSLVLVYGGVDGWFAPAVDATGFEVVFAMPGMVMATAFVALPLVIREVVPVVQEIGDEQEQAARSLGANAVQVFRRITLPAIRWAVVYGVVLIRRRFLGPVTQLGDRLIRPHDLELHLADPGGAARGRVERATRVGFEVRLDLVVGGQRVAATMTRTQQQALGAGVGDHLWVRPAPGAPTVSAAGPPPPEALVPTRA
ncbi:ABC transporter permease subunit [Saccharothrix carnea]|uniref:ABC transporter permease subunit n=1 Tax=Saccharothrix carnea TaxID=1280637 RepID=UPI0015E6CC76|nr:ABC transporter permease subunit [Saccharothrix carnea]